MGAVTKPNKVKLISGLIFSEPGLFGEAKRLLEKAFRNRVDYESATIDFTYTDYYAAEMGGVLKRRFISFKRPVPLEGIHRVKIRSNDIESRLSNSGRRRVNIDPGYLELSKLVLFSTKDYTHRIYLADGIFAEPTLFYRDGKFNPWPWTYPDYRTPEYAGIFEDIRNIYRRGVKV